MNSSKHVIEILPVTGYQGRIPLGDLGDRDYGASVLIFMPYKRGSAPLKYKRCRLLGKRDYVDR